MYAVAMLFVALQILAATISLNSHYLRKPLSETTYKNRRQSFAARHSSHAPIPDDRDDDDDDDDDDNDDEDDCTNQANGDGGDNDDHYDDDDDENDDSAYKSTDHHADIEMKILKRKSI